MSGIYRHRNKPAVPIAMTAVQTTDNHEEGSMAHVLAAAAAPDDDHAAGAPTDGFGANGADTAGPRPRVYFLDRSVTYSEDLHVGVFRSGRPIPVHLSFATDLSATAQERIIMAVRACRLCYRICEVARGRMPRQVLDGTLDPQDIRRLDNYARLLCNGHVLLAGTELEDRLSPTWVVRLSGIFQARGVCVFTCTVLIGGVKHIVVFTLGHAGCQWAASELLFS